MKIDRKLALLDPAEVAARVATSEQRVRELQEKRARSTAERLAKWQRRAKRASREVAKLKRRLTYYRKQGIEVEKSDAPKRRKGR